MFKTLLTTFAFIAFMAPAVSFAGEAEEPNCGYVPNNNGDPSNAGKWTCQAKVSDVDGADSEREVADSGNEGSTSAAQESDQ